MPKVIYIICDGLGDRPNGQSETPLSAAKKTNIDALARGGVNGLMHSLGDGSVPESDTAHLALFGYDLKKHYRGRGPYEALGAGMEPIKGDVAFRFNFATMEGGIITDRRAGRPPSLKALEPTISGITLDGCEVIFRTTVEHRGALILRGNGLSGAVSDTDPHNEGMAVLDCKPLDETPEARRTAGLVNEFTRKADALLAAHAFNNGREKPANAVLLRGAGSYAKVLSIKERYGLKTAFIAGGALYKGVARAAGMDVPNVQGATGTWETDLDAKAAAVLQALETHDIVFMHVKATDSFSHDGNENGKIMMIERLDAAVGTLMREAPDATIIITGDHSSPVSLRAHTADPVPVLVSGPGIAGIAPDSLLKFDEMSCAQGALGHLNGQLLFRVAVGLAKGNQSKLAALIEYHSREMRELAEKERIAIGCAPKGRENCGGKNQRQPPKLR